MISRLSPNVDRVFDVPTGLGVEKYYVCYWPVSTVSEEYYDSHRNEYTTLDKTFEMAKKSLGQAGLVTGTTASDGVNVPCLPPSITNFSPLTGVSGTILTITGENFDNITGITINNVLTTTGITVNSPFNLSVVVPYPNNGLTNAQQNPVIISGVNGSGRSITLFTYNPAQVTPVPSNSTNTNTQSQQTGPVTLIEETEILTRDITGKLTVSVNPKAAALNTWTLQIYVDMIVSVFDVTVVNNVVKETLYRTETVPISGYVTNNIFTITHNNVADLLVNNPIPEFKNNFITNKQTVNIKFVVTAFPTNKTLNPQNTQQSFNFKYQ